MQSETRIYTTVAKDRIVEEGDPEAAFLVAGAGSEVPAEYVHIFEEYQQSKAPSHRGVKVVEPEAKADEEPEVKAVAEPEAKAVEHAPENKARERTDKK